MAKVLQTGKAGAHRHVFSILMKYLNSLLSPGRVLKSLLRSRQPKRKVSISEEVVVASLARVAILRLRSHLNLQSSRLSQQ